MEKRLANRESLTMINTQTHRPNPLDSRVSGKQPVNYTFHVATFHRLFYMVFEIIRPCNGSQRAPKSKQQGEDGVA
ncbi:hypothetical protein M0657_010911 [Pyricularia oryzae]|nr:hypothetical protein M0657_010911 [Pyricularia oryzae]